MTTAIPDRGAKHSCAECATRFFDLHRLPAACPKCGQKVAVVVKVVRRRARRSAEDTPSPINSQPANKVIVTTPKVRPKFVKSK